MPVTIGSNIASLRAQRRLNEGSEALSRAFERLASGLRINRASDDAAGLSIASQLDVGARLFTQSIRNVNDALSSLSIAEGAMKELAGLTTRIIELAEQSANGVYTSTQRSALDGEAQRLSEEFARITATTRFNGTALLDGSAPSMSFQVGIDGGADSVLTIPNSYAVRSSVPNGTFNIGASHTMSNAPDHVRLADFNGDGLLDALTDGSQVQLALGNGNGTFKAGVVVGITGEGLSVGDLNADGLMDFAEISGSLRVYLGNGNGTFKTSVSYANSSFTGTLTDLNGDGALDYLGRDSSGGTSVYVQLGNGNGTFKSVVSYFSNNPRSAIAADIDNDGDNDLLVGKSAVIDVFLNPGNGDFSGGSTQITGNAFLTSGDFNSDGNLDLAYGSPGGDLVMRLGNGNATFKAEAVITADAISAGPGAVDLNDDGFDDIVRGYSGNIAVYLSNGNGSFQAPTVFDLGTSTNAVNTADINADGALDLVNAMASDGQLGILLGGSTVRHTLPEFDILDAASARATLDTMREKLSEISSSLGRIGASQSRLLTIAQNNVAARENYQGAAARIMDADIALEAAALTRAKILQQVGASVLAQANQQPALALQLLGP